MRILVVEDNLSQLKMLMSLLRKEGFIVDGYTDGDTGLYALSSGIYDLAIVDRLLPEIDGISLLRAYRARGGTTPVLLLTALSSVADRVAGLDSGADDYLSKPFSPEELLARIRALLRRPPAMQTNILRRGDLSFSPEQGLLQGPLGDCSLSKREGALLRLFLNNFNQILSRDSILQRVWGSDSVVEERNIDNFVFLLRRRLRNVGSYLQITTVRGFGYRMGDPHA